MAQIGDVVELQGERWVLARFEQGMARLLRYEFSHHEGDYLLRSFLVSPVALIVISHPVFQVGEEVRLAKDGERGTVLADPGDGPVRVQTSDRIPLPRLRHLSEFHRSHAGWGSGYLTGFAGGVQHASRADLILSNNMLRG